MAQLAHGEVLDDAVLDVVEAVVVGVEHLAGRGQVETVVGAHVPRHLEDAVEPRADPGVLGRLRLVRSSRSISLAIDVVRRLRQRSASASLVRYSLDDVVVALAELLADRLELLAQEELALLLVDRPR